MIVNKRIKLPKDLHHYIVTTTSMASMLGKDIDQHDRIIEMLEYAKKHEPKLKLKNGN